jgi:magnesium-transporting ATPase (P-type)
MKKYTALSLLLISMVMLSGCGAIETIFKAGMWWAFLLVALVIVVIIVIVSKARK